MGSAKHNAISFERQSLASAGFVADNPAASITPIRVNGAAGPWNTSETLSVSERSKLAFDIAQNFQDINVTNMAGHYSRLPDSVLIEIEKESIELVRRRRVSGAILTGGLAFSFLGMAAGGFYGFAQTPVLAALGLGAATIAGSCLKRRFANAAMDVLEKSTMAALYKLDAKSRGEAFTQKPASSEEKTLRPRHGYRPAFRL